jgi:flagellar protein FlaG
MVQDVSNNTDLLANALHANQNVPPRPVARNTEARVVDQLASGSEVNKKELDQALARVREAFQKADSHMEFSVDPDLGRVIVKIMDGESGTVIRQIPQQEILDLAKSLEAPTGLLLHHKA